MALLSVRDLRTWFHTDAGVARAVDGVSFDVGRGEVVGIVGESGCGKSVTSLSVMRLVPEPPGEIQPGSRVEFDGRDLLSLSAAGMRAVRGNDIAMVFQEPMTSLNPVQRVGAQVAEPLRVHRGLDRSAARERALELLAMVGIPSPEERIDDYPHQLSGGMRQRVMIASALACEPALLIADEPTTALDVTIQAQILELLLDLRDRLGMAVILITHDLGVIAETCDRVVVMYAGRVVEQAPARDLFLDPRHPYTQGLLEALPQLDRRQERLAVIPGAVPAPTAWPAGCRFHPRCRYAWDRCTAGEPELFPASSDHLDRCWLETATPPSYPDGESRPATRRPDGGMGGEREGHGERVDREEQA
ncbi:MAG: ABC transporter ATP-binding protein [Gemmatimonadota bacterium]